MLICEMLYVAMRDDETAEFAMFLYVAMQCFARRCYVLLFNGTSSCYALLGNVDRCTSMFGQASF
jgi:hypothetical protein